MQSRKLQGQTEYWREIFTRVTSKEMYCDMQCFIALIPKAFAVDCSFEFINEWHFMFLTQI